MRRFAVIGIFAASIMMFILGYPRSSINFALASDIRKSDAVHSSQLLQLNRAIEIARRMQNSQSQSAVLKSAPKSSSRFNAESLQALAGTVIASDGSLLPRAWVIAYTADSSQTPSKGYAIVNPDGSYLVEHLFPGDYFVVAEAEGCLPQYYDHAASFIDAKPVPVAESDTTTGINFALEKLTPGTGVICFTRQQSFQRPVGCIITHTF